MTKPRVTIGICARNSRESIGSAFESVMQQDYPHDLMERVFVDDGSVDDTLSIARKYASRIDIPMKIFSGKWQGLGKARNTVIESANGEYIVWLDSDELLEKSFVQKQVNVMNRNYRAGIVTAHWGILPTKNMVLTLELIPSVVEYSRQQWSNPFKLPGTGGATYRVKAARQVGGFDENIMQLGEDMEIANRVRKAGWSIVSGPAVFYETHGNLSTWEALLRRYFKLGTQAGEHFRDSRRFFSIYRMNPFASFVAGVLYAISGYRITKRGIVLALPFHFTLKMMAWFHGFNVGSKNSLVKKQSDKDGVNYAETQK